MLTQKHPPPLKIWFIYLISNTQTVPLKKKKSQKLLLLREIDAMWFQSPKIT